jgi:hypothetical protein
VAVSVTPVNIAAMTGIAILGTTAFLIGAATSAQDAVTKAGTVAWTDATTHMPENTGDKDFDVIQVELKTNPAAAK